MSSSVYGQSVTFTATVIAASGGVPMGSVLFMDGMTVLAPAVKEFLQAPNVAAFASVRPDGRPHVTPVWYEYDGREFIIGSFRGAQKLENVAQVRVTQQHLFGQL